MYIQWNLPSHKKEWNLTICNNMDGSRGYCAKWNKSDRERQMLCVFVCVCVCVFLFSRVWLFATPWILCPWNSPGKNTGVGCNFVLQEIFPTQGLNSGLLHCRQILYHLSHQGSPNSVWFHLYVESKENLYEQTEQSYRYRVKTGGCQRWGVGERKEIGEED